MLAREDLRLNRKTIPDELLVLMADKFRMLGDPTRLSMLRCLIEGQELNVGQLVSLSGRELANVSKHLKQMADAGLLARRKEGSFVFYRLDDPVLQKICELVCDSLRRDLEAEIERNQTFLRKGRLK
jgi:DNA-binding transcriptional ArsR family regulator